MDNLEGINRYWQNNATYVHRDRCEVWLIGTVPYFMERVTPDDYGESLGKDTKIAPLTLIEWRD